LPPNDHKAMKKPRWEVGGNFPQEPQSFPCPTPNNLI
jgi:hypothetical protein